MKVHPGSSREPLHAGLDFIGKFWYTICGTYSPEPTGLLSCTNTPRSSRCKPHPDSMQDGVQSAYLDKGCAGFHPRSRRLDATGTPSVLFRDRKHSQDLGVDGRTAAIYRKLLRHNVCAFGLLEKENARITVPLPASIYQGYRSLS